MNAYVYNPKNTKFTIEFTERYNRMHKLCHIVNIVDIVKTFPEMHDYITTLFHNEAEYQSGDFILVSGDEDFIQFYNDKKIVVDCFTDQARDLIISITDIDPIVNGKNTLRIVFIECDGGVLVCYYKFIGGQMYYMKSCFKRNIDLVEIYSSIRENKYSFGTQIALKYFA